MARNERSGHGFTRSHNKASAGMERSTNVDMSTSSWEKLMEVIANDK